MKCDQCKGDFSIWNELFWNGMWFYRDVAIKRPGKTGQSMKERVRAVMVCNGCLQRPVEYWPGECNQGRYVL